MLSCYWGPAEQPTCRRASRVRARWPKMPMMSPTLSSTGRPHATSRLRCCTPLSVALTKTLQGWCGRRSDHPSRMQHELASLRPQVGDAYTADATTNALAAAQNALDTPGGCMD